jgi:hypothetical protein
VTLKLIETTGDEALATWRDLKSAGHGAPVVLSGDDWIRSLGNLLPPVGSSGPTISIPPSVEQTLEAATNIRFPDDLMKRKMAYLAGRKPTDLPLGEWPTSPHPPLELSFTRTAIPSRPLPKVAIALVPTDDWTTIPAYLHWGGWNDCPTAEYHVAAMRAWRDRYGAELVGMNFDTINLRVAVKPETRTEALALARDQYLYFPDLIDQGVKTYSALAADLMANDWWHFWWD